MLWTIAIILLVLWLIGLVTKVVGAMIHLLLIIAAVVIIWNFISGRTTA